MLVKKICTHDVVTVTASTPVVEAAQSMRKRHAGDVIVVHSIEHGPLRPVGIVTDRDIALGVVAQATAATDLKKLTVGDLATNRDLIVAREDDDVKTTLDAMARAAVRRVPVIDRNGGIVGVLSIDDVLVAVADELSSLARLVRAQPGRERRERP